MTTVPARMVAVPVKFGTQRAEPFWSIATPVLTLPAQVPLEIPAHHTISLDVSGCGEGGLLKVPVAENGTWPLGKLCAVAAAGDTETDCNWRLLPQPVA